MTTVALYALVLKIFPQIGLLDFPERYGLQRPRLPYPAGIVPVAVFATLLLLQPRTTENAGLLIGIVVLGAFCFLDDRRPLSPWLRLGVQSGVALLLFATGARIYSLTNPLHGIVGGPVIPLDTYAIPVPFFGPLSPIGALFTVVWLGLTVNALNWFDGIPGQVSTLSVIAFVIVGLLSLSSRVNDPSLARLAFMLAAIALATLAFDFPPPRLLIGDTGAMFFGLLIGSLTIMAGKGKVATAFLVLGVPLVDSMIVGVRRMLGGRSPLRRSGGEEHLHHRLLARGWQPRSIILLTAGIGTAFGMSALFLGTTGKFAAAILLFLLILGLNWYARPEKHYGFATRMLRTFFGQLRK